MGFFDAKKHTCAVCGMEKMSRFGSGFLTIKDQKEICENCYKKICAPNRVLQLQTGISLFEASIDYCKILINKIEKEENIIEQKVVFDDENQECWIISCDSKGKDEIVKIKYEDIIAFELLEDNETIVSGGLGRAVVGGVLLGGVGAIVGGITGNRKTKGVCKSLIIKLTVKNYKEPTIYIAFITNEIKKSSEEYEKNFKLAQDCLAQFNVVYNIFVQQKKEKQDNQLKNAETLIKYKQLLDMGVITQDEFDLKKKELLDL